MGSRFSASGQRAAEAASSEWLKARFVFQRRGSAQQEVPNQPVSGWEGRTVSAPPLSRHPCKLTFEVFTNVIQLMFVLTSLRGAENSLFYSKHGLVVFFTD